MIVLIPARTRRHFLSTLAVAGGGLLYAPGVLAEQLALTPRQTEGPFYPTPAAARHRQRSHRGERRADAGRRRDHPPDRTPPRREAASRCATPSSRSGSATRTASTCIPAAIAAAAATATSRGSAASSPGRPASTTSAPSSRCRTRAGRRTSTSASRAPARKLLTTQCYVDGDPGNARDGVLRGIRDERARQSVIVPFAPLPQSTVGELQARFDIVLGVTPGA